MTTELKKSSGPGPALAVAGVLLFPTVAVGLVFLGLLCGVGHSMFRHLLKPVRGGVAGFFDRLNGLAEASRERHQLEQQRQAIVFDSFMHSLEGAHSQLTHEELQNVRLSLELLLQQHPEIHGQLSPELLRNLMEQYLSGQSPPQQLLNRAGLIHGRIEQLTAPPVEEERDPVEIVNALRAVHEQRLQAINAMPAGEEYNVQGMIEEERLRFLDEVNRALGIAN